jgi:hypothetical protein
MVLKVTYNAMGKKVVAPHDSALKGTTPAKAMWDEGIWPVSCITYRPTTRWRYFSPSQAFLIGCFQDI